MMKFDLASKAQAYTKHWNDAETARGKSIVLPDGTTGDGFADKANDAKAAQNTLITRTNDLQSAMQLRDNTIGPLQSTASLFTAYVRGNAPGSVFVKMLPKVPAPTAAAVKWDKVLNDINGIWERLDLVHHEDYPAVSLPVTLTNGMTHAKFSPAVAQFTTILNDVQSATIDIKAAQGALRNLGTNINADISAYRKVIRTLFPADHPICTSLP